MYFINKSVVKMEVKTKIIIKMVFTLIKLFLSAVMIQLLGRINFFCFNLHLTEISKFLNQQFFLPKDFELFLEEPSDTLRNTVFSACGLTFFKR